MITVGAPAWPGWSGAWQASIPEPDGEIVITRYRVIELLRKLDGPAGEGSGQPDGLVAGIGHEVQLARTDTGTWSALCGP